MRFTQGKGDAGRFIIEQSIQRGGVPLTTNGLPVITSKWRYSPDEYGVVIYFPTEEFETVVQLLQVAYGNPKLKVAETTDGGKLGVYRLTKDGGSIQFSYNEKRTCVIILRKISQKELGRKLIEAAHEMQQREGSSQ